MVRNQLLFDWQFNNILNGIKTEIGNGIYLTTKEDLVQLMKDGVDLQVKYDKFIVQLELGPDDSIMETRLY